MRPKKIVDIFRVLFWTCAPSKLSETKFVGISIAVKYLCAGPGAGGLSRKGWSLVHGRTSEYEVQ